MGLGARLQALYWDWVYLPLYDATVGQLAPYRRMVGHCLDKLAVKAGASVLSVGVGTGNEVAALFQRNRVQMPRPEGGGKGSSPSVVGVDLSPRALVRTSRKVQRLGHRVAVLRMDARCLGFAAGRFDCVLCLHTMDYLGDVAGATRELLRVLKPGGEFVVSYPAGRGSRGLAAEVAKSVGTKLRRGKPGAAAREAGAALGAGVVYLPLAFSINPQGGFLTRPSLEQLLGELGVREYAIQEDPVYQDLIVWGRR